MIRRQISPQATMHQQWKPSKVAVSTLWDYRTWTCSFVLKWIAIVATGVLIIHYLFHYIFIQTYLWQVTTLANHVQPVHRKQCLLPNSPNVNNQANKTNHHLLNQRNSYSTNNSSLRGSLGSIHHHAILHTNLTNHHLAATTHPSRKIGLLMLYEDMGDGNWQKNLMQRVIANRQSYAKRYGYEIIIANDQIDKSRPTAWSKLKAMNHYLYAYDYLLYIDMDVVIMNPSIPLSVYIDPLIDRDFIMTEDWNGVNTGIWLVKNTPFAHWFLQTAWNQSQLIGKYSVDGKKKHPFEYEQRAFHFLLQTKIWQDRKLPTFHSSQYTSEVMKIEHFSLLPQCVFNSYIVYPYYWLGDREVSQYVEGDFLVHFAGKKGKIKADLMDYYLKKAGQ